MITTKTLSESFDKAQDERIRIRSAEVSKQEILETLPNHSFSDPLSHVAVLIRHPHLKLKICFQIFSYLANSRYSFSPKL